MDSPITVTMNVEIMDSAAAEELPADASPAVHPSASVFTFPVEATAQAVAAVILEHEHCPYNTEVSLTLVDDEEIHRLNREFRGIDSETDVLSFPNVNFPVPSDFSVVEAQEADCIDPETGALVLGDIVINVHRVQTQAAAYGHSQRREFAFLVAHSMLHLCGYDHMTAQEESVMEGKQEAALQELGITRESVQE